MVSGQIRQAVCFNVRFFTRFEDCHFRLHEVMSPCKRASFRQIYRQRFGFCGIVQRMCLCRKLAGLLPACPTSRFLPFDAWRVVWAEENILQRTINSAAAPTNESRTGLVSRAGQEHSSGLRTGVRCCALEKYLQRKLCLPRTGGSRPDEYATGGECGSRTIEKLRPRLRGCSVVDLVEQVEEFCAELNIEGL